MKEKTFYLPPRGLLEPNGPDDPLPYYYHPIVGFLYCARIRQAVSLLEPPYASILEIGYGSGVLMPTLASIGNTVCGVDIESRPEAVLSNLRKLNVQPRLSRGDICDIDYPRENFDLIVAISIFEHVHDIARVIDRISMILRPGGHFLVGMPRLGRLMKMAFPLIGYHDIEAHHVTDYRSFLEHAQKAFSLARFAAMPSWLPVPHCLYYNMLFKKPLK